MFVYSCKDVADLIKERLSAKGKTNLHIICNDTAEGSRYVRSKCKVAYECSVIPHCHHVKLSDLNQKLDEIMETYTNGAMIIQLPFDKSVDNNIDSYLSPELDADGLCKNAVVFPATAKGVFKLLEINDLTNGKNVVIIGRSKLVGKPLAKMLMETDATVTLCHSKTANLKEYTKNADVIVIAIGKPKFLTKDYLNPNRTVHIVDVGINVTEDGKLVGDVDPTVQDDHTFTTPVPGGVGLLTTACLMDNVHILNDRHNGVI